MKNTGYLLELKQPEAVQSELDTIIDDPSVVKQLMTSRAKAKR